MRADVLCFGRSEVRDDRSRREQVAEDVRLGPGENGEKGSKLATNWRGLAAKFTGRESRGRIIFYGIWCGGGPVDDQARQINKYKDIDSEQTDANPRDAADDLEDFPRQKGSGDGESEKFAPRLFQIKADALGEGYSA